MSAAARSSPGGRRGLADSPLFAFFHALSFCVELFKREIPGSFMLMCRTKAAAHGRAPGRGREAGVAERGSGRRAARVSRVPLGRTKQLLIPANTKPVPGSGLRAALQAPAPPGLSAGTKAVTQGSGWDRGSGSRRAWGGAPVNAGERSAQREGWGVRWCV